MIIHFFFLPLRLVFIFFLVTALSTVVVVASLAPHVGALSVRVAITAIWALNVETISNVVTPLLTASALDTTARDVVL